MFRSVFSKGGVIAALAGGTAIYWGVNRGEAPAAKPVTAALTPPPVALSADEWRSFKLVHKEALTKGVPSPTVLFRFALPDKTMEAGLPVASCVLVRAPIGSSKPDGSNAFVIRPYTPISGNHAKGHMDLAIKVYPDGKMSQHVDKLKVGDSLDFKGPIMKISLDDLSKKARLGLICGGSGLTPMIQVVEELYHQNKSIEVSMIYANVSEKDIIAKERLDALAKQNVTFDIHYAVDKSDSKDFEGSVGYINRDLLAKQMPPPASDSLILVCGPPGMMKSISGDKLPDKSQGPLSGLLKDMGYTEQQVFKF
ncbi:hypothetical protein D9Q98_000556 [Chlorella vulgaris]|uniref:cytochrome-b5 reductase n=1 Tax=Chlorella vulgaris TaxID=3077 RepID=A0A9D4Z1R7_CHLVU|nr:hypothetical protein D9Q98_000556 [Chlorella vulgaris]